MNDIEGREEYNWIRYKTEESLCLEHSASSRQSNIDQEKRQTYLSTQQKPLNKALALTTRACIKY